MDWSKIIAMIASAGAMPLMMLFFNSKSKVAVKKDITGRYTLRLGKAYLVLSIVLMIIGFGPLVTLPFYSLEDAASWIAFSFILLFFGGLGLYLYSVYKHHSLAYNDEKIIVAGWNGKKDTVLYTDIIDLKHSRNMGRYTIYTKNNKVHIHEHLKGVDNFIERIEKYKKLF